MDQQPNTSSKNASPGESPAVDDAGLSPFTMELPTGGREAGIELHELAARPTVKGSVQVQSLDYCPDQFHVEHVTDLPEFLARHRPAWSQVRWINVHGLKDMEAIRHIAEKYGLHPLAIEDVLSPQRPKAEDYPGSGDQPGRLFTVARRLRHGAHRLQCKQISLFLGRHTLVTFEDSSRDIFESICKRVQVPHSRVRQNDVSFLLYTILDAIIDDLFPVLEEFGVRVEEIETTVLKDPSPKVFQKIRALKRDLIALRRVVWPMRELILQLRREPHECLSENTQTYLRDVYDHIVLIFELIENYRDLTGDLMDTYMSAVSHRTNVIMKTLTIISTIFVPLTFFAGVYGMNMPIPENDWAWSYPIFWLFSLTVIGTMLYWFRRRKWF